MKSFLFYFIEFKEDDTILLKEHPNDYAVKGPNWRPIIMITYDKSTFSANNNYQKIWTLINHAIFCPKGGKKVLWGQILYFYGHSLNLFSLFFQHQKELVDFGLFFEAVTYFKYGKIKKDYQIREHLLDQINTQTLLIKETLYRV